MPILLGLDLVAVGTVEEALRGAHAAHYLERIYTEREVEDCRGSEGAIEPERLAARFAAKEATIKALPGAGEEIRLTTIEVRSAPSGEVRLELAGKAAEIATAAGVSEIAVSLTHEAGFAAASVLMT